MAQQPPEVQQPSNPQTPPTSPTQTEHDDPPQDATTTTFLGQGPLGTPTIDPAVSRSVVTDDQAEGEGEAPEVVYGAVDFSQSSFTFRIPKNGRIEIALPNERPQGEPPSLFIDFEDDDLELGAGRIFTNYAGTESTFEYLSFLNLEGTEVFTLTDRFFPENQIEIIIEIGDPDASLPPESERVYFPATEHMEAFYIDSNDADEGVLRNVDGEIIGLYERHRFESGREVFLIHRQVYGDNWARVNVEWVNNRVGTHAYWTDENRQDYQFVFRSNSSSEPDYDHQTWQTLDAFIGDPLTLTRSQMNEIKSLMNPFINTSENLLRRAYATPFIYEHLLRSLAQDPQHELSNELADPFEDLARSSYDYAQPEDIISIVKTLEEVWPTLSMRTKSYVLNSINGAPEEALKILADLVVDYYQELVQMPIDDRLSLPAVILPSMTSSNHHSYFGLLPNMLLSPRIDDVTKTRFISLYLQNAEERYEANRREASTGHLLSFLVEQDGFYWDLEDFRGPLTRIATASANSTVVFGNDYRDLVEYLAPYISDEIWDSGLLEDWIQDNINDFNNRNYSAGLINILRVYDVPELDRYRSTIRSFLDSVSFESLSYDVLLAMLNYLEVYDDSAKHRFYQAFIPLLEQEVSVRVGDGRDEYHSGVDNNLDAIVVAISRHQNSTEFVGYYDHVLELYNPQQEGESSENYQARLESVKGLFRDHHIILMDLSGAMVHGSLAFGSDRSYVDLIGEFATIHPHWTDSVTLATSETGEAHGSNLQINWQLRQYDEPLEFLRVLLHEGGHTADDRIGRNAALGFLAQDHFFNYHEDDRDVPSSYARVNVYEHFAEMVTYIERDTRHWLGEAIQYYQEGHPSLLSLFLSILRSIKPSDQPSEDSLSFTYLNEATETFDREWVTGRWVEGNERNGTFEILIDGEVYTFEYENYLLKAIDVPFVNHAPQVPELSYAIATGSEEAGQIIIYGYDADGDDLELQIFDEQNFEITSVADGPVKNSWVINYRLSDPDGSSTPSMNYLLIDPYQRKSVQTGGASDVYIPRLRFGRYGGVDLTPPDPQDVSLQSTQGKQISIRVPGIDDYESPLLFFGRVDDIPSNGNVMFNPITREFEYTPNEGFVGTDSFTYFFNTGVPGENTESATVTIEVAEHDGLVPISYDFDVVQNTTQEIFLDRDLGGIEYVITQMPSYGRIIEFDSMTGRLVYEAPAEFIGNDIIQYQVNLGSEMSEVASVTLNVLSDNRPPVASNMQISINEDTSSAFVPNISDPDGDDLEVIITSHPPFGTLTYDQLNQVFVYEPEENYYGLVHFSYVVSDGSETSNEATVSLDVLPVNDPPSILEPEDQAINVHEDFHIEFEGSDLEGLALTYSLAIYDGDGSQVAQNDLGILFDSASGELDWNPSVYDAGVYRFVVSVSDGEEQTSVDLDLLVTDPFDALDVNTDGFITPIDALIVINYLNGHESDNLNTERLDANRDGYIVPNDVLRIINHLNRVVDDFEEAEGEGSSNATGLEEIINLLINDEFKRSFGKSTGDRLFRGEYDYDRNGTVNYDDVRLLEARLALRPTNVAPTALNESIFPNEDEVIEWPPRITDSDGDDLQIRILEYPEHGELTYDENRQLFRYVPDENYNGLDEFRYEVFDGLLADESTISIDVRPVNDEVVLDLPGPANVLEDEELVIQASLEDVEDDFLQVVLTVDSGVLDVTDIAFVEITGRESRELVISGRASEIHSLFERQIIVFIPDENYFGTTNLSMSVLEAGSYVADTLSTQIVVSEVNDMPVMTNAFNDLYVFEDSDRMSFDLAHYFSDVESSNLHYFVDDGSSSRLNAQLDGSVLNIDFIQDRNGIAPVTIHACEDEVRDVCTSHTFDVFIRPVDDPPVISDITSLTILENSRLDIDFAHYVQDIDTENEDLTYRLVMTDSNGVRRLENEMGITLTRQGYFVWTPTFDMSGVYDMLIEVSDGSVTASERFQLTVNNVNQPPVANDMNVSVDEDGVIEFSPDVSDPDGDSLDIRITRHPSDGTLVYDSAINKFRFTPSANFNGNLSFRYRAQDQDDVSGDATVNITVNAVQDRPTAITFSASIRQGDTRTFTLRGRDLDGDRLTYRIVQPPAGADIISIDANTGRFVIKFNSRNAAGRATLRFVVNDGTADSTHGLVNFTITPPPAVELPLRVEERVYVPGFGAVQKVTQYRLEGGRRVKLSENLYKQLYAWRGTRRLLVQSTTWSYFDAAGTRVREKVVTKRSQDGSVVVWRESRTTGGRVSHHIRATDRFRRLILNRTFRRVRPTYHTASGMLTRMTLLDTSQAIYFYRRNIYISSGRSRRSSRHSWRRY